MDDRLGLCNLLICSLLLVVLMLPEELLVVASELEVVSEHSNKHLQSMPDILNKSIYYGVRRIII